MFDPKGGSLDWKLIVGAICFGIGWGIAGICPGPFLVLSPVATVPITLYWGLSMVVGMYVAKAITEVHMYYNQKQPKIVKTA